MTLIEFTKIRPDTNENKYWRIGAVRELPNGQIVVRCEWGRIGTKGSFKEWPLENEPVAWRFIETKTAEKMSEGYQRTTPRRPTAERESWLTAEARKVRQVQQARAEEYMRRAAQTPAFPEPPPLRRIIFDEE